MITLDGEIQLPYNHLFYLCY